MTIGIITIVLVFVVLGIIAIRRDLTHLRPLGLERYATPGISTPLYVHDIPTDVELEELSDANWLSIPEAQRSLCKAHLLEEVPAEAWVELKEHGFDPIFHFRGGMAVRNCLRDVLLDKDLPRDKNWDDYYMGCLREILREME
jgi:hypothetical protein